MIVKPKNKSLSVLIHELDLVFGEYIKLRDTKNGVIKCFVCGWPVRRNECEVLHFVPRQHMSTRFSEINCHAGCVDCNKFDDEHNEKYHKKMVQVYGSGITMELTAIGVSLMKFMRSDIIELLESYRAKIKNFSK